MKKINIFIVLIMLCFILGSCNRTKDTDYIKKVEHNRETIAVGLYKATGFEYPNIKFIAEAINIDGGVWVTLTEADVLKTKLENIDVLVFPEMNEGEQFDKFDDEIATIFKNFILNKGKGVIGFCNGAGILSTNQECQSLDLIDIDFENNNLLKKGMISFNLTDEGLKMFPELEEYEDLFIYNHRSPKIIISDTSNVNVLGQKTFDGGSFPLFVTKKAGKGKIVIINTSPETTPGMRWMIPRLIRWSVNKDFTWYNKNVLRPELYQGEVDLAGDVQVQIEELISKLENGKKDEVVEAMDKLQAIYPWSAAEKVRSLMIEKKDEIKLRAAKYLVDIEYTLALEDFNKLIDNERSKKVKEQLIAYRNELELILDQN